MNKYSDLKFKSNDIALSTETKVRLLKMLEDLGQYVDLALSESEDLADHWANIDRTLNGIHKHSEDAEQERVSNVYQDVRTQLRLMYQDWKSLHSSTAVISRNFFAS